MRARILLLCLAFASMQGCEQKAKITKVSGTVTLDGKPLANASVSFQPNPPEGSASIAAGSIGTTNEKGEYTLKYITGEEGCWVGTHRVRISLPQTQAVNTDARPPPGGWPKKETIPPQFSRDSELTFDVPPGGTKAADFQLTSPKDE